MEEEIPTHLQQLKGMAALRETSRKMFGKSGVAAMHALLSQLQSGQSDEAMSAAYDTMPADETCLACVSKIDTAPTDEETPAAPADETDRDYDTDRDLDAADNEDDGLAIEIEDEGEENPDKWKCWIAKVGKMTDRKLASPRIDAVHEMCNSLGSKDLQARIVVLSRYVKFPDMVAETLRRRFTCRAIPTRWRMYQRRATNGD